MLELWGEALKDQGPLVGLLGLIAYFFMRKADKAQKEHITTLKEEIDRLAKSRNRLEEMVLNNRMSSNNKNGKDDEVK